jgi:hypothetical protein
MEKLFFYQRDIFNCIRLYTRYELLEFRKRSRKFHLIHMRDICAWGNFFELNALLKIYFKGSFQILINFKLQSTVCSLLRNFKQF